MSLYWRVFVINAVLVLGATATLALSPATVSAQLQTGEVLVLAVGVVSVLVLNFLLVRRTLDPLERLTRLMRRVDLVRPGSRIAATGGGTEVVELTHTFNQMLERLEAERRESGRRAIQAQEQERRRIALELHDEVGQLLTGVVLGLDGLARTVDPQVGERVAALQDMVRQGAEHVREIARGLRPESLEELGLRSALIGLIAGVGARGRLVVRRRIDPDLPALPPDVELVVYRVVQESLTNVLRHAAASEVEVALRQHDGVLELRVRDDGVGLDLDAVRGGRGLAGMFERALYVGGRLEIEPASPAGTSVTLTVPLTGAAG
ncbi:MAG TPA: histidine kinase [Solirubrobacteraceae bacterium]|nr:histidine kinase [Solirubrobacteraceae bacterium]